jgi:hypothetical protein
MKEVIAPFVPFIRFPLFSVSEIASHLTPHQILPNEQILALFTYSTTKEAASRAFAAAAANRPGNSDVTMEAVPLPAALSQMPAAERQPRATKFTYVKGKHMLTQQHRSPRMFSVC